MAVDEIELYYLDSRANLFERYSLNAVDPPVLVFFVENALKVVARLMVSFHFLALCSKS